MTYDVNTCMATLATDDQICSWWNYYIGKEAAFNQALGCTSKRSTAHADIKAMLARVRFEIKLLEDRAYQLDIELK